VTAHSFVRELTVSSNLEQCWNVLTDVLRVASWVSIARDVQERERLRSYTAVLEDRLGPFRLRADLDITVSDVKDGERLTVRAEGEDRQVASQIRADAELRLEPNGGGTRIVVEGSYEVTGRVAMLGASMISAKAQKIVDEFFEQAEKELA
jgi:carbon monoxide dehydrogenase subunit G